MEINMKPYNLESFKEKDIYTWEEIINTIENLECDLHTKEEELENLQKDLKDNFKRISISEQVGINNNDFI